MFYGHEKEFRSYEESKKSYSLDTTMRESWHVSRRRSCWKQERCTHPNVVLSFFFVWQKGFSTIVSIFILKKWQKTYDTRYQIGKDLVDFFLSHKKSQDSISGCLAR